MQPRISLCMIVRDSAAQVLGLFASIGDLHAAFDEICIVDTAPCGNDSWMRIGSFLAGQQLAWTMAHGGPDVEPTWFSSDGLLVRWDAARNRSFGLASGDWKFVLDSDDLMPDASKLRGALSAIDPKYNYIYLPYVDDAGGRVTEINRAARTDANARWVGRYHERLIGTRTTPILIEDIVVHHAATRTVNEERGYAILQHIWHEEGAAMEPRLVAYLAFNEIGRRRYVDALAVAASVDDRVLSIEERTPLRLLTALAHVGNLDMHMARVVVERAVAEDPGNLDALYIAAYVFADDDADAAERYFDRARAQPARGLEYVPRGWIAALTTRFGSMKCTST